MSSERIEKISRDVTDSELDYSEYMSERLNKMECEIAQRFKLSRNEFLKIMRGEVIVEHITYAKCSHTQWRSIASRVSIATLALLLILCLSIEGMADGFRESILRIFTGPRAVSVESVVYDQYDDLLGYIVPAVMPSGYTPNYYAATEIMLYISYKNDVGHQLEYYYYPQGASASHDNERAEHHVINSKFGSIHVWLAENGRTTVYLLIEGAYIQMDFDREMNDAEIIQVVNGLHRVE